MNKLKLFVKKHHHHFLERIRDEKIWDIHEDLYLKNIFIRENNKFCLYDRTEFNDSLRYADVAEDVAHLAMDLDFHGRKDLRNHFVSTYVLRSRDRGLEDVIWFFMCYKACIRAKVSLFGAGSTKDIDSPEKKINIKRASDEAKMHLRLAEIYMKLL